MAGWIVRRLGTKFVDNLDGLTPWALLVLGVVQLFTLIKAVGPQVIKSWQETVKDKQDHTQQVEMSKQEVTRLEVLQGLHNQTYRDEQSIIFLSDQQELITTIVDAIIGEFKAQQDIHALQLTRIKEVCYQNQDILRQIEKLLYAEKERQE